MTRIVTAGRVRLRLELVGVRCPDPRTVSRVEVAPYAGYLGDATRFYLVMVKRTSATTLEVLHLPVPQPPQVTVPELVARLFAACRQRSRLRAGTFAVALNDLVSQTARHPHLTIADVRAIEAEGIVRADVLAHALLLADLDPAEILRDLLDRVERDLLA